METACGKRLKVNYRKKVRLGDVLVKKGIIDENQLQTALSRQREQGKMLGGDGYSIGICYPERY